MICLIEKETLENIADSVRNKIDSSQPIKVSELSSAIDSISVGSNVEPIVLTGDCGYACAGAVAGAYIENYGKTISTDNLTGTRYMFYRNTAKEIPFELKYNNNDYRNMSYMFAESSIQELPKITNAYPNNIDRFCSGCYNLRTIPEDFGADWNWEVVNYGGTCSNIFSNCYSLRKVPDSFLSNLWGMQTGYDVPMYGLFNYCYSLDEINNFPIHQATLTTNRFVSFVDYTSRLKSLTFAVNEDGTPKTANWKNQTLDLYSLIGYCTKTTVQFILEYNSGITADKEVKDKATYQELKNDPDWFSRQREYSRYNHDSAVETINSLPDTSAYLATAGGTNTIRFDGRAGSLTDGGAINTLTEAEIAVAAAKGWTVSLV